MKTYTILIVLFEVQVEHEDYLCHIEINLFLFFMGLSCCNTPIKSCKHCFRNINRKRARFEIYNKKINKLMHTDVLFYKLSMEEMKDLYY